MDWATEQRTGRQLLRQHCEQMTYSGVTLAQATRLVDAEIGAPAGTVKALIYARDGRGTKRHAPKLMGVLGVPAVTFMDLDRAIGALVRLEAKALGTASTERKAS